MLKNKRKIGIALGGGGARGFAHIGVLSVLKEAGIECDVISGTSIGSLVGAIYANGTLEKFANEAKNIKLFEIPGLLSLAWSAEGVFSGKKGFEFLKEFIEVENIEDLDKPFVAIAADLYSPKVFHLNKGKILEAIRASISIPFIFTPVKYKSTLLVDGAIMEPLPIEAAYNLGADFVIAVDLFGYMGDRKAKPSADTPKISLATFFSLDKTDNFLRKLSSKFSLADIITVNESGTPRTNIFDVIERTLALSQTRLTELRIKECPADIVIRPDLSDIGLLDFHRGEEGIEIGRKAAEKFLPELKKALA